MTEKETREWLAGVESDLEEDGIVEKANTLSGQALEDYADEVLHRIIAIYQSGIAGGNFGDSY